MWAGDGGRQGEGFAMTGLEGLGGAVRGKPLPGTRRKQSLIWIYNIHKT